jgi:hypothetical protein
MEDARVEAEVYWIGVSLRGRDPGTSTPPGLPRWSTRFRSAVDARANKARLKQRLSLYVLPNLLLISRLTHLGAYVRLDMSIFASLSRHFRLQHELSQRTASALKSLVIQRRELERAMCRLECLSETAGRLFALGK